MYCTFNISSLGTAVCALLTPPPSSTPLEHRCEIFLDLPSTSSPPSLGIPISDLHKHSTSALRSGFTACQNEVEVSVSVQSHAPELVSESGINFFFNFLFYFFDLQAAGVGSRSDVGVVWSPDLHLTLKGWAVKRSIWTSREGTLKLAKLSRNVIIIVVAVIGSLDDFFK